MVGPHGMSFRIRKGTHVSHFHRACPLWWGNLCEQCAKLADTDAQASFESISAGTRAPAAGNPVA
jgi:hypothetical protein